jgi:flagellar hook-length control protein FliK
MTCHCNGEVFRMPVSVPIHFGPMPHGQSVPLVPAAHEGGLAEIFTGLVSALLPRPRGANAQSPAEPVHLVPGATTRAAAGIATTAAGSTAIASTAAASTATASTAGQVGQKLPENKGAVAIGHPEAEPLASPAKAPANKTRTHDKKGKDSSSETAPIAQSPSVSDAIVAPGFSGQTPQAVAPPSSASPVVTPPQPSSDMAVAGAPRERPLPADAAQKPAEPHRATEVSARDERSLKPNVADASSAPAATSPTGGKPESAAVRADVMLEAVGLSGRSDAPQAAAIGSDAASPARAEQVSAAPTTVAATPVDQVAPALVGILKTTDGTQSVTVRLQPSDLGQVQIRLDRTAEGTAHVAITADKPETLQLLQRDEPRLQQVLDQAGVLSTGRSISFQAMPTDQVGASASRPDSMAAGSGNSGQGQSGGAWREHGDEQQSFGGGASSGQGQTRTRWFRAGLDITA